MCHGVCQVLVHLEGDRVVKITGDKDSPVSRGFICPKGAASADLLYHPDRITTPLKRVGKRTENKWKKITWEEAYAEITEKLDAIRTESGSEYFGMLQGTGRPYTGFTQRFTYAFGSPNFTGVAHLCYIPRVLASMLTFGQNIPVADIYGLGGKTPECILEWGSNIIHNCGSDGMCGGMFKRAVKKARDFIVIDPRRTEAAEKAGQFLQIRPGTDGALALALVHVIVTENLYDHDFVRDHTLGFDRLEEHIKTFTPEWAEPVTRIPAKQIRLAARTFAGAESACIQWGNAIDMSASNFHTARLGLILMAITGNLDRPGGNAIWVFPEGIHLKSPFANLEFSGLQYLPPEKSVGVDGHKYPLCPIIHSPSFWESIVSGDPYRLRALWIMGSNPLLTMTNPLKIEKALEKLEYIIVSDLFMTPTAQYADIFLPASTWLERDDVVNMHKNWCVTAQQKVAQVGECRDDREVLIAIARRLGLDDAFPWPDYPSFLNWMFENSDMTFEEFKGKGILKGSMRYFKYKENGFPTGSRKFEIHSELLELQGVSSMPVYREPPFTPVSAPELAKEYPLILIAGYMIRHFFHTEYRQIPSLRKHNPDPIVEINPETANALNISNGDWVIVETPENRIRMKAKFFDGIQKDVVCAQHGWWFPEANPPDYRWKESNVNLLFGEMPYDPDTGSESIKSALCRVYSESISRD
jgi:anaerobic selenocysteine-containing dehydrogenase